MKKKRKHNKNREEPKEIMKYRAKKKTEKPNKTRSKKPEKPNPWNQIKSSRTFLKPVREHEIHGLTYQNQSNNEELWCQGCVGERQIAFRQVTPQRNIIILFSSFSPKTHRQLIHLPAAILFFTNSLPRVPKSPGPQLPKLISNFFVVSASDGFFLVSLNL